MTARAPAAAGARRRPPGRGPSGCPLSEARDRLRRAGLRPTAQRCAVAWLLTASPPRHLTPETLYAEAAKARISVSMSSIYNIVRQFTEAGLLRQRILSGGFVVYDTDLRDHQHFIVEGTGEIIDLPDAEVTVAGVPEPPEGFEVAGVELVVRLRARPPGH